MLRFLPWVILLFPALELWVLIQVGKNVGAFVAIGLVALSTMAGLTLLRLRGFHIAKSIQAELAMGRVPSNPIVDTFCMVVAGWLFIFPGFVSDSIAVLLLIPFVRRALLALFITRLKTQGFHGQTAHFQSASGNDAGPVTWNCTTYGGTTDSPNRHDPRGNAVIIDCEPGEVTRKENTERIIQTRQEHPGGSAANPQKSKPDTPDTNN